MMTWLVERCEVSRFAEQIYRVMQAAYTVEAELLGVTDFFPLRRTVSDILSSPNRFFCICEGEALLGVCELEDGDDGTVCLSSLVVHPDAFRRGVASALLAHVLAISVGRVMVVSTAVQNEPAVRLYQKYRFAPFLYTTLPDGMELVELRYEPIEPVA